MSLYCRVKNCNANPTSSGLCYGHYFWAQCLFCETMTPANDQICMKCWTGGKRIEKPEAGLTMVETQAPAYMCWLHQRARRGQADRYGGSDRRMVQFEITPVIQNKWPELTDAIRISVLYRGKA